MSCTATYTKVTDSELNEVQVQCRFTSTEAVRSFRGGHLDFHTAPELCFCCCCVFFVFFTSSSSVLLYVHGDRTDFQGRGGQGGHLDIHTAPELRNDLKPLVTIIRFPGEPRRSLWTITPIHISQKQQQRVSVSYHCSCHMLSYAEERWGEGEGGQMKSNEPERQNSWQ